MPDGYKGLEDGFDVLLAQASLFNRYSFRPIEILTTCDRSLSSR